MLKATTRALKVGGSRSYATVKSDKFITILEASARDGLQNEAKPLSVATKVELINRLVDCGLKKVEAGAFVSPKWVPQMAGTAEVLKKLPKKDGITYTCLAPNEKALEIYWDTHSDEKCDELIIFAATSESFNKANLNRTVAQSMKICEAVAEKARAKGVRLRGSLSTVIGCPFEGPMDPALAKDLAKAFLDMGCYQVALGDTIGVGTPATTEALINECAKAVSVDKLAMHSHDTWGSGVANVLQAVRMGIRTVDSSIGGLGGCPYAPGATGNVSTEDVVYALHNEGYETGVDLAKAAQVGQWISDQLEKKNISRAGPAQLAKSKKMQEAHFQSS